ncbi:phage filamentation protein Fil family protein [Erwinia sp. 198]
MSYGHGWIMGENGKRWHPVFCTKNLKSGSKLKEVSHGYRS